MTSVLISLTIICAVIFISLAIYMKFVGRNPKVIVANGQLYTIKGYPFRDSRYGINVDKIKYYNFPSKVKIFYADKSFLIENCTVTFYK